MKISASFLSIENNLKENIDKLTSLDIDYLHLDIMDGVFVKNKTYEAYEIENIINYRKPLDVHLMVEDVYKYIDDFKKLNPSYITFHYEVKHDIMDLIKYLKKLNISVGISIKPDTKVGELLPYLPYIDLVLVMSVEPGAGGQKFIESSIDKINELFEIRNSNNYKYLIEVDGGINDTNIKYLKKADILVIGSFITNGNYKQNLDIVKEKIYG